MALIDKLPQEAKDQLERAYANAKAVIQGIEASSLPDLEKYERVAVIKRRTRDFLIKVLRENPLND